MQVELGGDAVFLKAEDDTGHIGHRAAGRAARPGGRVRHPRVGRRADRPRDRRGRCRHRRHHPAGRLDGRVGLGHPRRRPGRARASASTTPCSSSPATARTARSGQDNRPRLAQRDGIVGLGRGLRRRHGRHRDRGARPHRARRPDLDRPGHRDDGVLRRRRRDHAAARRCSACSATGSTRARWSVGTARPSAPRTPPGGASGTACRDARGPTCSARSSPCSRSRPRRCGSRPRSRPPGTHRPRPRTGRPTTCWPRGSAPGSTGRCWWSWTSNDAGCRRGRDRRRWPRTSPRSRGSSR